MLRYVSGALLVASLLVTADRSAQADERDDFFEAKIRPVLVGTCFRCHGEAKSSGALRIDSRAMLLKGGASGPAIVPGKPDESLLIRAIRRQEDVSAMPPEKDQALRPDQVTDFVTWVKNGAIWPAKTAKFEAAKHWAFEPIRDVAPPDAQDKAWGQTSIDPFIRARQAAANVRPAPIADKLTRIRRATFDLTGLPPTSEEVAAFLQDTSPRAFEAVVERLLKSSAYGERWGRHWLDVVRYADTAGETADYPVPLAWRYRNYVIDSFNADKPYDEFLREQIAGDVLAQQDGSVTRSVSEGERRPTPADGSVQERSPSLTLRVTEAADRYAERVTATGYLAISRRFGFDSENYHHLTIQDTIDTLGQTVLGLSLGCARCHDHKFDAVSMHDYYALYGIFDSSRYAFPGSEQKPKVRSMAPLVPPSESQPKWREFETRVAALAGKLANYNQPVFPAVLRSLNDFDGDFELQAQAGGGSNGVLVPPWLYSGKIDVSNLSQSPFKNLYLTGKSGVSVPVGAGKYRFEQALHLRRTSENCGVLYVNLDFKVVPVVANQPNNPKRERGRAGDSAETPKTSDKRSPSLTLRVAEVEADAEAAHRFMLGAIGAVPAIEVLISSEAISLRIGKKIESLSRLKPNQWHNLQLALDLKARTISGRVGMPGSTTEFSSKPFLPNWSGAIDSVVFDSNGPAEANRPAIEFDNLGIQETPISPVSTESQVAVAATNEPVPALLAGQLAELIGIDGDLELQTKDAPPVSPWNPGPNSVVKLSANSQSPFRNVYPLGELGIHMPNRGEYDGFGLTLANVSPDKNHRLFVSFDFRCASRDAGGDGSWRYYLGHGPGPSAAVELFFNGREFFRRSANVKESVGPLVIGEWYQVQLTLDLKAKTYTGVMASRSGKTDFKGELATGWDGTIDYSFIDSYGHIGGVRPSLDADNVAVGDKALPPLDAPQMKIVEGSNQARRAQVAEVRQQLAAIQGNADKLKQEHSKLLAEGPFAMTYGMAEGTPHNVRMQMRGEPGQPGAEVPRGFIKVLGDSPLPATTAGSGRLELAQWLTRSDNPLTPRVMVNRIWQYHFGRGLVKTPNDFGVRGLMPTHPELLDHLATQFIRSGWSVKAIHRLIMLSATYQQASVEQPGTDATNATDLYASFSRRRLSAEEIRDAILAVSGELDRTAAREHPFPPPSSWSYTQHGPFSAVYDHNQRSVYLMTQRLKRHPFLALFDGADPNTTTAERLTTTVPTQALFFLNDPFVYAKAEKWAIRLLAVPASETERIEFAWRTAVGRPPTQIELAEATEFLTAYRAELTTTKMDNVESRAIAAYLRTLIGSNEFLHVE